MRKLLALALALLLSARAYAADNYAATQGTGTTFAAKDNGSAVLFPRVIGCDNTTTTQCWTIDSSGRVAVLATISGTVTITGAVTNAGTFAVQAAQSGTWNITNAGTFAVQATQAGTWNIGTVAAVTAITNALPAGTNVIGHIICDSGCAGSGGTSSAFGSAFPANGTALGLTNGTNMVAWSATTNYGTAPSAIAVPSVNAFVTNTNANGSAVSASSSPVVVASDQAAIAVKAASGAIASGAIASGAVASGAIASGAFASGAVSSGAYASGSLASGAVVDITNMSGTTGAAPPAKAIYNGALASGATGGQVAGIITCDKHVFKHITTATDTLAVQGVASQTIRICGWRSRAAGVATWFLENTASANANCSSTLTQITGVATEAANTGETMLAGNWTGLANTSGNGLCINSTGTGGVDIDIWYNQF